MTGAHTPGTQLERRATLLEKLGARYLPGTPKAEVLAILNQTAFKTKDGPPSNAQVAALLVVADQYGLNPWTREIFAFPDKQNGIVPVVGIDGWNRIANEHPQFAGEELELPPRDEWVKMDEHAKLCPSWIRVKVHRRDRDFPTDHTEYLDECYRPVFRGKSKGGGTYEIPGPWQSHTKRMLEHKARIQARRIAFGFAGIYDEDEAERIVGYDVEGTATEETVEAIGKAGWAQLLAAGAELGMSGDDLLANAAAFGHEGAGPDMPRDVAQRLMAAIAEATPDDDPDDDEPTSATAQGDAEDVEAEGEWEDESEADDATGANTEAQGALLEDEPEPPGMDAEQFKRAQRSEGAERAAKERSRPRSATEAALRAKGSAAKREAAKPPSGPRQTMLEAKAGQLARIAGADATRYVLGKYAGTDDVKAVPGAKADETIRQLQASINRAREASKAGAA